MDQIHNGFTTILIRDHRLWETTMDVLLHTPPTGDGEHEGYNIMQDIITITELRFGRNIKGVPMDGATWRKFQKFARRDLETVGQHSGDASWVEVHTGTGTWVNEDGVRESEESAVATLYVKNGALTAGDIELLKRSAATLALAFRQDAVAVVAHGTSYLLYALVLEGAQ
jgi:hypothetical protein